MNEIDGCDIRDVADRLGQLRPDSRAAQRAVQRAVAALGNTTVMRYRLPVRAIIMRASAAAALVIGVALLVVMLQGDSPGVVFAAVRERIEKAKSVRFTETIDMGGGVKLISRVMIKEPGLIRREIGKQPGGQIEILDYSRGVHLALDPHAKMCFRTKMVPPSDGPQVTAFAVECLGLKKTFMAEGPMPPFALTAKDFLAEVKELVKGAARPLGEKLMASRKAKGFRVGKGPNVLDIWVDTKTGWPARVEKPMQMPYGQGAIVMDDFAFDVELDASLFSTDPPAGYKVHDRPSMWSPVSEKDLVNGLDALAKLNDGVFPPDVSFTRELAQKLYASGSFTQAEQLKLSDRITLLGVFLQKLQPAGVWRYVGSGVKAGDKAKPILWYMASDAKTCRVIYGDFSARDIDPAKLSEDDRKFLKDKIAAAGQVSKDTMTATGVGVYVVVTESPVGTGTPATQPAGQ